MRRRFLQKGFTLIELITVIIVLGVLSVGITSFVGSGVQIFVDTTERDQLVSESRFVVERLNRELRNALPNSIRVSTSDTRHCIEFTPVVWSSFYFSLPISPDEDDEVRVVAWSASDPYVYASDHRVVVYPISTTDVYDSDSSEKKVYALDGASTAGDYTTLDLGTDVDFATDSPSSRVYIADSPVSYCMSADGQINRYQDYGVYDIQDIDPADLGTQVLMAENASNCLASSCSSNGFPFRYNAATLNRNASVLALLQFALNDEIVEYNNEVHLPNVP